jgi:hypothetical protein
MMKALGRWTAHHGGWPIVAVFGVVALVAALTHSLALASLMASPAAFGCGIVVSRRRGARSWAAPLERRREGQQSA